MVRPGGVREPRPAGDSRPRLAFRYDAARVSPDDPKRDLEWLAGSTLVTAPRDPARERALQAEVPGISLSEVALTGLVGAYAAAPRAYTFLTEQGRENPQAWLRFVHERAPALRGAGWEIEHAADFPYDVREPDEPVAVEIEASGDNDWFGLSLGIEVDGERLDLTQILPVVLPYVVGAPAAGTGGPAAPEDHLTYVRIADSRYLALPTARLARIAGALRGLFNRPDALDAAVPVPGTHLGELAALEAAAQNGHIAVSGGTARRGLAAALSDGGSLQATPPPAKPAGVLRDYQQRGLDWLQTLARHGFGGHPRRRHGPGDDAAGARARAGREGTGPPGPAVSAGRPDARGLDLAQRGAALRA